MTTSNYRSAFIPNTLWVRIVRAIGRYQQETGKSMSKSEFIRRAIEEKLEREGTYAIPSDDRSDSE